MRAGKYKRTCNTMSKVKQSIGWLKTKASSFAADTSGNMMIMAAVLLPAIVAVSAVAVDYSSTYNSNSKLQQAADNSAIASAREMVLPNASAATIQAVAENYVAANLASSKGFFTTKPTVLATVDKEKGTVEISISGVKQNAFGGFLQPETTTLKVNAVARSLGGGKTCIIVLESKAGAAVELKNGSQLKADDCAVYSNSVDGAGITILNSSRMAASKICSAGGLKINGGTTSVKPVTDCPVIDDPLAYKTPPPVGSCDYNNTVITNKSIKTLDPGVYCGGLTIKKFAQVNLRPGVYIMKDGPLIVTDEASFIGKNVGIYFLGDKSDMLFRQATTIELSAPKAGPMAGMLMFSDRGNKNLQPFTISSDFARVLVGTIYLPNGLLTIDSNDPVGDKSAYTVIVSKRFHTAGYPEIVVNSNYDSTDIPVPDGVGPGGQEIVLIK